MGVFSRTNPTAAFNYVISQIASSDVTASTQALVQFERVIRNKNHKEVSKHIDQVRCIWLADGRMRVVKWRLGSLCVRKFATHYYFLIGWVTFFLYRGTARACLRAYIDTRKLFLCCILPFPTIKAWSSGKCRRSAAGNVYRNKEWPCATFV